MFIVLKKFVSLHHKTKKNNNPKNQKKKKAKITKSIWGNSYCVEERISSTLHYTHFNTLTDAINYCKKNKIIFEITCNPKEEKENFGYTQLELEF